MWTPRSVFALVIAGAVVAGCHGSKRTQHQGQAGTVGTSGHASGSGSVASALDAKPAFVTGDKQGTNLWGLTKEFYQKRDAAPAWIDDRKPTAEMDQLIDALQHADREGLDPALYNASTLAAKRQEAGRGFLSAKGFDEQEAMRLDVWLTYLYLRYANDLSSGLSDLSHADPSWQIHDEKIDLLALLERSLAQKRVSASLAELTPAHQQYTALRDALAQYRQIAQQGGWPALPATLKLKPGQQNAAVPQLAKRLAVTGDFKGTVDPQATTYAPELQEAVKRFQRRHGLQDDAAIGPAVVAKMNVPIDQRIEEISLNLDRWRWLPRELGDRHILVNIPEYRLEVWDHERVPLTMKVVVGKKDTPTPIFNDEMTHVIFAPYWNIPPDIASKETMPSAMRDPAFLSRMNMEVLDKSGNVVDPGSIDPARAGDYRFRQRPGSSNALGYVKFMFPNQFNVYLHDTPADSLFERASRSFSHGCVRLEQPEQLAQYVLNDQPEWTADRIQEAMHGGQEKTVKLKSPIPVYLGYWTARVSADGILQFRDDVYNIDARQMTALAATLERLKTQAAGASSAAATPAPARKSR